MQIQGPSRVRVLIAGLLLCALVLLNLAFHAHQQTPTTTTSPKRLVKSDNRRIDSADDDQAPAHPQQQQQQQQQQNGLVSQLAGADGDSNGDGNGDGNGKARSSRSRGRSAGSSDDNRWFKANFNALDKNKKKQRPATELDALPPGKAQPGEASRVHRMLYTGGVASMKAFDDLAEPPFFLSLVPDQTAESHLCFTRHPTLDMSTCNPNAPETQQFLYSSKGHFGYFMRGVGHFCMTLRKRRVRLLPKHTGLEQPIMAFMPEFQLCHVIGHLQKAKTRNSTLSAEDLVDTWRFEPGKGLVHTLTGMCLTYRYHTKMTVEPCEKLSQQWVLRVDLNGTDVQPRWWAEELAALAKARAAIIDPLLGKLRKTGAETGAVIADELARERRHDKGRRAVVLFLDGDHKPIFMQVLWWIKAWRELKLDQADQMFDVIIAGSGDMFQSLTEKGCLLKALETTKSIPPLESPGVCWLFHYIGINHREPGLYDPWFNRCVSCCACVGV